MGVLHSPPNTTAQSADLRKPEERRFSPRRKPFALAASMALALATATTLILLQSDQADEQPMPATSHLPVCSQQTSYELYLITTAQLEPQRVLMFSGEVTAIGTGSYDGKDREQWWLSLRIATPPPAEVTAYIGSALPPTQDKSAQFPRKLEIGDAVTVAGVFFGGNARRCSLSNATLIARGRDSAARLERLHAGEDQVHMGIPVSEIPYETLLMALQGDCAVTYRGRVIELGSQSVRIETETADDAHRALVNASVQGGVPAEVRLGSDVTVVGRPRVDEGWVAADRRVDLARLQAATIYLR